MFQHLIGHTLLKSQLQRLIETDQVPQALLFAGPDGVGKTLFARAIAAAILARDDTTLQHSLALAGQHPDYREYVTEGKSGQHSIEALRELSAESAIAPYLAKRKIFVIQAAERMLPASANALLKTFEEPAPHAIIILVTSMPSQLLPTILSRCCKVHFGTLAPQEMAPWLESEYRCTPEQAYSYATAARGSLARACQLARSSSHSTIDDLLPVLAQGRFASYAALTAAAQALAADVENSAQQMEEGSDEADNAKLQSLTAVQRHERTREAAGSVALQQAAASYKLLEDIAAWYRDLTILRYHASQTTLWHTSRRDLLQQALERGSIQDLDYVMAAIDEAQLSLQRSNPLTHVLETLFLRLSLL
jgi:DNA polymerase-3 subunit delta'